MTYQAQIKEAEALETAEARGYALNPWTLHGKELLRLNSALCDALTWKQYHTCYRLGRANMSYRSSFERALKVSRSAKVRAIATEGLKLVERCEALAKAILETK